MGRKDNNKKYFCEDCENFLSLANKAHHEKTKKHLYKVTRERYSTANSKRFTECKKPWSETSQPKRFTKCNKPRSETCNEPI